MRASLQKLVEGLSLISWQWSGIVRFCHVW